VRVILTKKNSVYFCPSHQYTFVITKWQKYSQTTTIFISYERVDHKAVYNYMFRPPSAIVRLYFFLL